MARLKDQAVGVKDLFMLDPRTIQIEPGWNVRQEGPELENHIQALMTSIREIGVQEPLTIYVKNDVPILTNGHCRLTAVLRLLDEGVEIKAVPCRTEERFASEADRVLAMVTRNSGKNLTPLEMGMVYKRLIGYGWEVVEIAKKVGQTAQYVEQLLELQAAPAEVVNMVKDGRVAATTAAKVVRKEGTNAAKVLAEAQEVAKKAGKTKVTPKHVEQAPSAKKAAKKAEPVAAPRKDAEELTFFEATNLLEDGLIQALGGKLKDADREKAMEAIKPIIARILKSVPMADDHQLAAAS